jgi:simple sugar transport system substrate-binding protein
MMNGEANATVELTPNMAGPAFDALLAMKKDGKQPDKFIQTESRLLLPDTAKQEYETKKDLGY